MPFYSNYGYHPRLDLLSSSTHSNLAADDFAQQLWQIQDSLKFQLQIIQESYKTIVDKFRNEALILKSEIWLLQQNSKTKRPSDKLDYRRLGPFVFQKQINSMAYCFGLPPCMKVHRVFYVYLLEPYSELSIQYTIIIIILSRYDGSWT